LDVRWGTGAGDGGLFQTSLHVILGGNNGHQITEKFHDMLEADESQVNGCDTLA